MLLGDLQFLQAGLVFRLDGFDFDRAEAMRLDSKRLAERFPAKVRPRTPNQILRGDGLLVEADTSLYSPDVVSSDPGADFEDYSA